MSVELRNDKQLGIARIGSGNHYNIAENNFKNRKT